MAVAICGAVLVFSCATSIQLEQHPGFADPDSRWVQVDDRSVHYIETGGKGCTVVVVHGFASYSYPFEALIHSLPATFHVVAPDLPGHGFSEGLEDGYTMSKLVSWLHRFTEEIGLTSFVLCGSSMGANVVAHYAVRFPNQVEKVVLMSPVGLTGQAGRLSRYMHRKLLLRTASALVGRGTVRRVLKRAMEDSAVLLTSDLIDAYALSIYTRERRRCLVSIVTNIIAESELDGTLPRIWQPTLVIAGGKDPLVEPTYVDAYRRLLPNSKIVVFSGGSHLIHQESPAEIAELICEFSGGSGGE